MTSTYTSARSDLRSALVTAAPDWAVHASPTDAISDKSLVIGLGTATIAGPTLWRRELIVGVFARRDSVEASLGEIESIVPTIARLDLDGVSILEVSEPRPVDVADSRYLAVFVTATMETTD